MTTKPNVSVNRLKKQGDYPTSKAFREKLLDPKSSKTHPSKQSSQNNDDNATLFFVGIATTILEWEGTRLMTEPMRVIMSTSARA
jgi:hypothetical protein